LGSTVASRKIADLRPPQIEKNQKKSFGVWLCPCGARQLGAKAHSPPRAQALRRRAPTIKYTHHLRSKFIAALQVNNTDEHLTLKSTHCDSMPFHIRARPDAQMCVLSFVEFSVFASQSNQTDNLH